MKSLFSTVFCLALVSSFSLPSLAFDCTPITSVPLDGTLVFGIIGDNAVPGEVVCGNDYTGEDMHVLEFTLPTDSEIFVHLGTGGQSFGQPMPDAELVVLANCDPNGCIPELAIQTGFNSDPVCLPAGTYTIVISSPAANGSHVYATAIGMVGNCTPIAIEDSGFGVLKSRF